MIYGLGAALGWGLADFMVALVSRRIGSFTTVLVAQAAGLVFFAILWATGLAHLPAWHPGLLVLPPIGITGALAYMAFYRGLELGPLALVTPIVSGYAAIVIALSLLVVREHVAAVALAGAGVVIVGVSLAATDVRALRSGAVRGRSGVAFAAIAMTLFGVGAFLIGRLAKDDGWFASIFLSRIGSAITLAVVVAGRRSEPTLERLRALRVPLIAWIALIGVLDIGGFAMFARGSELGFIAITAAASVIYPLIPVLFGVVHFRERLAANQWAGVAVVVGGLALLAVGR